MTLTLTQWTSYMNLTSDLYCRRYTRCVKMNFLRHASKVIIWQTDRHDCGWSKMCRNLTCIQRLSALVATSASDAIGQLQGCEWQLTVCHYRPSRTSIRCIYQTVNTYLGHWTLFWWLQFCTWLTSQCAMFVRCQSLLSTVGSKLDKENALRLQLMFASDMETGNSKAKDNQD